MLCPRCKQREVIDGDGVCQQCWEEQNEEQRKEREKEKNLPVELKPINMIIVCPKCGMQHIDAPEPDKGWTNPPHKSHQCHYCNIIWRVCELPTNGVPSVKTRGEADTWPK